MPDARLVPTYVYDRGNKTDEQKRVEKKKKTMMMVMKRAYSVIVANVFPNIIFTGLRMRMGWGGQVYD